MARKDDSSDESSSSPSRRKKAKSGSKRHRDHSRSKDAKRSRSKSKSRRKAMEKKKKKSSPVAGRKRAAKSRSGSRRRSRSQSERKKGGGEKKKAAAEKEKEKDKKDKEREKERPVRQASPVRKRVTPSRSCSGRESPSRGRMKRGDENGRSASRTESAKDLVSPSGLAPSGKEPAEAPKAIAVERKVVLLRERPFGMAPSKEAGVTGYVVAKVAEGRPADAAGVQVGWRLVAIGQKECQGADLEEVQALLKSASLPLQAVFEKPQEEPIQSDGEEDDDEEVDVVGEHRAAQRLSHASSMASLDDLPVTRTPKGLPDPIVSWGDACNKGLLNKALVEKLQAAGLKRPTLIQRYAMPIIGHQFNYYDLIALAQTGSGKTFAFVIPTLARLVIHGAMPRPFFAGKSPGCPLLLVLSPTRELAQQTFKEMEVLSKGTPLLQICIYGGETLKFQQQRIEKTQIDILCATPGRLIDLIDSGKISLSFVQSVVLDEADQMLEQSLEIMCAEILTGRDMPDPSSGRQTLLFSATMPQKIRDLCPRILRQDRIGNLTIGHYGEDQGGSCASIRQILRWVPDEAQRVGAMVHDLRELWMNTGKKGRVVIFTNQRLQANALNGTLMQHGFASLHLHGKLDQHIREEVFDKFRRGQADILVATNVASRGLDFPDISFVVQYNLPQTIDIYTHRIGRTGRVGQVGASLAYVGPKDRHLMPKLVEFLELNKQDIPSFLKSVAGGAARRSPPRPRERSRSRRRR